MVKCGGARRTGSRFLGAIRPQRSLNLGRRDATPADRSLRPHGITIHPNIVEAVERHHRRFPFSYRTGVRVADHGGSCHDDRRRGTRWWGRLVWSGGVAAPGHVTALL
jgi:hypothetical protein